LILAICAAYAAAAVAMLTAFAAWKETAPFIPRFDLVVEVDAPKRLGCFEAYTNANYGSPARACLKQDGPSVNVLANVPAKISGFRLDTGDEPDIDFVLKRIRFVASEAYAPAPGRTLAEFGPKELAGWAAHELTIDGPSGRMRTSGRDPQLNTNLDLDLSAKLAAVAGNPSRLASLPAKTIALLLLELAAAGFIVFIIAADFRAASSEQRQTAWIVGICVLGWLLTIVSAFPGHSNFDELFTLTEYWSGTLSDVHPPLQTVVWSGLMNVGRAFGLGPVGQAAVLLAVQAAVFWSVAGIMASWLTTPWLARAFLLVLALSPVSQVYLGHIGKDSETAIALLAAVVFLGQALRHRSTTWFAVSIIPLFYGFAVRANGPAGVFPLCLFWIIAAARIRGLDMGTLRAKAAVGAASLVLFVGLLGVNKGFNRLVIQKPCCYGEQLFLTFVYDLVGLSVRLDRNVVPPEFLEPGYDLATMKKRFDLLTTNLDGLKRVTPDLFMLSVTSWLDALRQHPHELIGQRLNLLRHLFGMHYGPGPAPFAMRFYVGTRGIQSSPRAEEMLKAYAGLSPQFFELRDFFESYFLLSWTWPTYKLWVYVVIFAGLMAFPAPRPPVLTDPAVWLATSAAFYVAPFLMLANSAHYRYLWWPTLALFCASILRLDAILAFRRVQRTAAAPLRVAQVREPR
jgi:hypothetical protein